MLYPSSADQIKPFRMEVKRIFLNTRGRVCERCGRARAIDLDEGIVTRGDMRGFSDEQKVKAFCECNLFLLCKNCNRHEAHQREWAFQTACDRYGEDKVRRWYRSLNLKAPRKDFL